MSKQYIRSIDRSQTVSLYGSRRAHNVEFEGDVSIDYDVIVQTASSLPLPCSNSDEQFFHNEDEVLSTTCGGFTGESSQCDSASDEELLEFTECKSMYARVIKEDETLAEEREREDDMLFSGMPVTTTSSIVLILSFVMKYKLTQEVFVTC